MLNPRFPAILELGSSFLRNIISMTMTMPSSLLQRVLAILPLLPPLHILCKIVLKELNNDSRNIGFDLTSSGNTVGIQLLLFLILGILGHFGTYQLIPGIRYYMLKRGICGKDYGKKGTQHEDIDV